MGSKSIPVLVMVFSFCLTSNSSATTLSFQGLGYLQGKTSSEARSVSADGSVAVGYCLSGAEAFRWTESGNMQSIGEGHALGVSADGSVVVGDNSGGAYRWTQSEGMVNLGSLPNNPTSCAVAVSDDGLVVVGNSHTTYTSEAFRWTESGGMVGLGALPGGGFESSAWDVSSDGSVIVGYSYTPSGSEAFRWTESGGMKGLGFIDDNPLYGYIGHAFGVSADGSVVVGISASASASSFEAFIWDEDNGMRSLKEVLINDLSLDLTGWRLRKATGISDDGFTIVGYGTNPSGNREAWIASIPEPSTLFLLICGALVLKRRI